MGEFRKRLREMMEQRGMRNVDLAAKTGISSSLISSYLAGRWEPQDEKLKLLADALDCDALWLAGYDDVEEGEETDFLDVFRNLKAEDKNIIITLLKYMSDKDRRNAEGK